MKDWLLIFRGQVWDKEIYPKLELYKNNNIELVVEDTIRKNIINSLVNDLSLNTKLHTTYEYVGLEGRTDIMKFKNVLINPPYSIQVGSGKTQQVWGPLVIFTLKSTLANKGNYEAWHPLGWRNISGDYRGVWKEYQLRNVTDIEINDIIKGMEVFGEKTPYDRVLLTNEPYKGETNITFSDGTQKTMDISKMDFIPNCMVDEVMDNIAKPNEERMNILFDTASHHTQSKHMKLKQESPFTLPCVYSILLDGTINFWYSSESSHHFGIPKLILGNGANSTSTIDENGKYGVTQYSYGIIDKKENLPLIEKALHSEEFQKINQATKFYATGGNPLAYPRVLSKFRKDFWKKYV